MFKSIAFVLFTLMFFKVSSFHVFTHQDTGDNDIEHCTVCDVAIANQDTEWIAPAILQVHPIFIPVLETKLSRYTNSFTSTTLRYCFFGRPPPATI